MQVDERDLTNGVLHLHAERIPSDIAGRRSLCHDEEAQLTGAMIGYFSNMEEIQSKHGLSGADDLTAAMQLFAHKGIGFLDDLEGVFTIFLWDHRRQIGYIAQDEYGSNLPLYYRQNVGFHFSTSLKRLLAQGPYRRRLNQAAVADFLYHRRIVPNGTTLVEGIHKLVPGQYIVIDAARRSFEIRAFKRDIRSVSCDCARADIVTCVERQVRSLLARVTADRLACTLSGGFDSTLLLHILATNANSTELTAVTVGGRRTNEVPQACRTAAFYPRVIHKHHLIGEDGLDWLPDIVWRLEGYVFEEGIFLQYALGRMLAAHTLSTVFLGDGADQQLDRYRFSLLMRMEEKLKQVFRPTPLVDLHYRFIKKDPARPSRRTRLLRRFKRRNSTMLEDPLLDVILKKNGLMLNSFSIQGVLPFLSRELRALSEALGRLNSQKRFYKNQVLAALGKDKMDHLLKIGGQTDIEYLMRDRLPALLRTLEAPMARDILTTQEIDEIRSRPQDYHGFILQLVYLHLFNELFISGRSDSAFSQPHLDLALSDFLEGLPCR
jgi:asparagine synthetase B (glutamine-hydrolysing)